MRISTSSLVMSSGWATGNHASAHSLQLALPLLILGFLLLSLFSCQNEKPAAKTNLLLDWLPNPNHVPLYVGIEKGIFAKHGINLDILKVSDPGDSLAFISSGKADLSVYYMPETCLALTKGANIQPVGYLIKEPLNSLIYRKGEGINTPTDFNDKIVGYVLGSFGLKFLKVLLAQNNIHVSDTLRVNFDLVSTLGTNRVDIIYGAYWNIEGEHLRSLGVDTNHVTLHQLGLPKYFELLILANSHSPYANPEFIDRFKLALQESIDYSIQHPYEAYDLYLSANPDKGTQAIQWEREAWLKTIPVLARNQDDEAQVWEDFCLWAKKYDIIPVEASNFHVMAAAHLKL